MDKTIEQIQHAKSPGEVWACLFDYYKAHNVSRMSYHHQSGMMGRGDVGMGIDLHTEGFPEFWVSRYIREEMSRVDPIFELARSSVRPFFWRDIHKIMRLSPEQKKFLREMAKADLGDGVAFQVFGPRMRNGYAALGLIDGAPRWKEAELTKFQTLGQIAHMKYCQLTNDIDPMPVLSPREKEILFWMAQGKSNTAIAEILEVSRHTVDTLVRRIFEKLHVTDRTTAALRGVGAGVIPTAI